MVLVRHAIFKHSYGDVTWSEIIGYRFSLVRNRGEDVSSAWASENHGRRLLLRQINIHAWFGCFVESFVFLYFIAGHISIVIRFDTIGIKLDGIVGYSGKRVSREEQRAKSQDRIATILIQ